MRYPADLIVDFKHDTTYGGSLLHRIKLASRIILKLPVHNRIKGTILSKNIRELKTK